MNNRINILIIDKDMNTLELDIPNFMLKDLNYDQAQLIKHSSKKELNATVTSFLQKYNQ